MPQPQQLSLVCPACSTRLRLTDAEIPEDEFDCPDCAVALRVIESESGDLHLQATPAVVDASEHGSGLPRSSWIALLATSGIAVLILVLVVSGGSESSVDSQDDVAASTRPEAGRTVTDATPIPPDEPVVIAPPQAPNSDVSSHLLTELTNQIEIPHAGTPSSPDDPTLGDDRASGDDRAPGDDPAPRVTPAVDVPDETVPDDEPVIDTGNDSPTQPVDPDEVTVPVLPELPRLSFKERLEIDIASFEQSKPASLSGLVEVIEQLAQSRIEIDDLSEAIRNQTVSFSLKNTTPLGILTETARLAGARVIVDDDARSIRLVPGTP